MRKDWSDFIKVKIKEYDLSRIIFTKQKLLNWLAARNDCSIEDMKKEILNPKSLVFADKQTIDFEGQKEDRYRCYFIYSNTRGRFYILNFNSFIKVITAVPLGRRTLRRYKKRFK